MGIKRFIRTTFSTFATMKPSYWIGLFFAIGLVACKPMSSPPSEENMLYHLEGYCLNNPDSSLYILDTLNVSVLSNKEQAHYCLLRANILFKFDGYNSEIDSLIQIAENQFVGSNDKYYEALTYSTRAFYFEESPQTNHYVLDYYQKAKQSIDQCKHVDERLVRYASHATNEQGIIDRLKYKIYQFLGAAYVDADYIHEGIQLLKLSERYYFENQEFESQGTAALMIGFAYMNEKEYDSCQLYFDRGLHAAKSVNDTINMAYFHHYIAMEILGRTDEMEDCDEKTLLLRKAIHENKTALALLEAFPILRLSDFFEGLANAYFDLHEYDSCIYYANRVLETSGGAVWKMNAYNYLYKSYQALGDNEQALAYLAKYTEMQGDYGSNEKDIAEVKDDYDKQLEINQLESKHRSKYSRLYLWIVLLVIVLAAVVFMAFRYRKNKRIEGLQLQDAHQQQREAISQLLSEAQTALKEKTFEDLKKQAKLLYDKGSHPRQSILEAFNMAYPDVYEKLEATYPDLTEQERDLLVLNFLQFRIKEEAEILELSQNTVTKYRSNLIKKVGKSPVSDLLG